MARRENRIVDSSLIGNLVQSVSFYASTTTYVIAGLIAVAGTVDRLVELTADLPFGHAAAREVMEVKVILLVAIFIFAYFKFTWSLRQFNFVSILVGAAPGPDAPDDELERMARAILAAQHARRRRLQPRHSRLLLRLRRRHVVRLRRTTSSLSRWSSWPCCGGAISIPRRCACCRTEAPCSPGSVRTRRFLRSPRRWPIPTACSPPAATCRPSD